MKPIIAVDLDGALMRHRPFVAAHVRWFDTMADFLKDKSLRETGYREGYFDKVHDAMKRYLGDVEHETRVRFAREIYAMAVVAEARKEDVVADFADYLRALKQKGKYSLALITSAPESCVEPLLKKTGCFELFDFVYKSPMTRHPDKKQLFREFVGKHAKPVFYIGNGDKDITSCRELGIKTISVNWVSKGEIKGDYDINTVKELERIVK